MDVGLLTLGDHREDALTGKRTSQEQRHKEILEYIDYAEPAGFDAVFIGEHHFSDFIVSAPHVFLSWLAARTSTIRLGTGVTLLPHHDPVRLAEDFATLDVVSGGRAEVWCGRGVEPAVYGQFGQDVSKVLDMQQEGLELLVKLWTERNVSWSGQFRPPLDNVTLEPRPVQSPHVPIYLACSSPESAASAARMGLGVTISLLYFPRSVLPGVVESYYQAWEQAGHDHEPRVTLNAHVHVAPTSQEARDHLGVYQFPFQRWVFSKKSGLQPRRCPAPAPHHRPRQSRRGHHQRQRRRGAGPDRSNCGCMPLRPFHLPGRLRGTTLANHQTITRPVRHRCDAQSCPPARASGLR